MLFKSTVRRKTSRHFLLRSSIPNQNVPSRSWNSETVHDLRFFSDNSGIVAIDEPELIGRETFFHISSHGYSLKKDGFGFSGTRFKVTPGNSGKVEITRENIAERLYRITGAGRFSHSIRAGLKIQPEFENSGVFGCDSVLNAIYRDRLFWIWGDTDRGKYPLGNFHSTGAASALDFDLEKGISLDFFEDDDGFVKPMAKLPGEGPTWLTGLAVFPDKENRPRLVATYQKVKGFLTLYETGLCEFNDQTNEFEKVSELDLNSDLPNGHPFEYTDESGKKWMIYADPLPSLKIPLSYEAWKDPAQHEAISTQAAFVDIKNGEKISPHRGSLAWNEFRKKWVMIFTETKPEREDSDHRSQLGEVFYSEADSPFGPWTECLKIATHNRYSFYNPKQHPYFQKENGRVIYFEGTYTHTFSRAPYPTPRYDYNQVLYRLDLSQIEKELEN